MCSGASRFQRISNMPRGGARPGSGRKAAPGSKRTKSAKAARAIAPAGEKPASEKAWPFGAAAPAPEPDLSALSPLDYLLSVVRDRGADEKLRMQAASIAAPFVHIKPGDVGKKAEKQQDAAKI